MRRVLYSNKKSMTDFPATGKCLNCKGELQKRQRKWCSWDCNNAFWIKNISPYVFNWGNVRLKVLERDKYTCQKCNIPNIKTYPMRADYSFEDLELMYGNKLVEFKNGIVSHYTDEGLAVDHIIALVNGGTDDLANLQTLCVACHRKKTKKDMMVKRGAILNESLETHI